MESEQFRQKPAFDAKVTDVRTLYEKLQLEGNFLIHYNLLQITLLWTSWHVTHLSILHVPGTTLCKPMQCLHLQVHLLQRNQPSASRNPTTHTLHAQLQLLVLLVSVRNAAEKSRGIIAHFAVKNCAERLQSRTHSFGQCAISVSDPFSGYWNLIATTHGVSSQQCTCTTAQRSQLPSQAVLATLNPSHCQRRSADHPPTRLTLKCQSWVLFVVLPNFLYRPHYFFPLVLRPYYILSLFPTYFL
jgi:hypothetical protein